MPFAQIYLQEGRSEEKIEAVLEKVTDALVEATGTPREKVRVWVQEVPKTHWGIGGVSAQAIQNKK